MQTTQQSQESLFIEYCNLFLGKAEEGVTQFDTFNQYWKLFQYAFENGWCEGHEKGYEEGYEKGLYYGRNESY